MLKSLGSIAVLSILYRAYNRLDVDITCLHSHQTNLSGYRSQYAGLVLGTTLYNAGCHPICFPVSNSLTISLEFHIIYILCIPEAMSLAAELSLAVNGFKNAAPPEVFSAFTTAIKDFEVSFQRESTIKVGDTLPEFRLSDAVGNEVCSSDLIAKGPILINFYRGEWCPFCNLALAAMQKHLGDFKAKGVTLVAISPELPNQSLSTTEKHNLQFPVLSDVGNKYAEKLGILFAQPNNLRPIYDAFGTDFKKRNGDNSLVVPVPAVVLVDRKGVVRNTYINPDYMQRVEPSEVLEWINAL